MGMMLICGVTNKCRSPGWDFNGDPGFQEIFAKIPHFVFPLYLLSYFPAKKNKFFLTGIISWRSHLHVGGGGTSGSVRQIIGLTLCANLHTSIL